MMTHDSKKATSEKIFMHNSYRKIWMCLFLNLSTWYHIYQFIYFKVYSLLGHKDEVHFLNKMINKTSKQPCKIFKAQSKWTQILTMTLYNKMSYSDLDRRLNIQYTSFYKWLTEVSTLQGKVGSEIFPVSWYYNDTCIYHYQSLDKTLMYFDSKFM